MPSKRATTRRAILAAAEALIKERGARSTTVDAVAKAAGCAKGLVHYHFKTKRGLLESVAEHLAVSREGNWTRAFRAPSPKSAIERTWILLTRESADGTIRAWTSLFGPGGNLPDRTVSEALQSFSAALGTAAYRMLEDLNLSPTIPPAEVGWLLGAVINGMGLQVLSQADHKDLEGAYAAAWLGILSLTTPQS